MMIRSFVLVTLCLGACNAFTAPSKGHAVVSKNSRLFINTDNNNLPDSGFGAESVPHDQRPVNEYLNLLRAPLFRWASEENGTKGLLVRLGIVYAVSFGLVCWPIAGATYTNEGYFLQKLAAANVGSLALVGILLARLFTGWSYVGARLQGDKIEYEETGWYDGDWETKSKTEKQRDSFVYQQNVAPVVDRLKMTTAAVGSIFLASVIAFNTATSVKPVFDEYNPQMLKQLKYDDKMANAAADMSFGRPTYCNSRYYRAVANGGQGCD